MFYAFLPYSGFAASERFFFNCDGSHVYHIAVCVNVLCEWDISFVAEKIVFLLYSFESVFLNKTRSFVRRV